jgi:uncharacterized membrane protein YkvI
VVLVIPPKIRLGRLSIIPGIAATFVGTIVGAGFASGQEIYRFFSIQGLQGFLGVLCSVFLLGAFGEKVFRIGIAIKPKSYKEFFDYCMGPAFSGTTDAMISIFLIILVGVMFAGSGAIFTEIGLGYWAGIALSVIIVIFTLFQELPGLIFANLIIVPVMFGGALVVAIFAIQNRCVESLPNTVDFSWILAGAQFSSYNLVLAIPILLSLSRKYPWLTHLKPGGWLGSVILGVMAGLIHWSILSHFPHLQKSPLPMMDLARIAGKGMYWIYAVVLWCEMLTTLLADIYGVAQRLAAATGGRFRFWVIILTLAGILIGEIGFSNLVAKFYPLFGFFCLVVLFLMMTKKTPQFQPVSGE